MQYYFSFQLDLFNTIRCSSAEIYKMNNTLFHGNVKHNPGFLNFHAG